jgi:predicted PurR-regulated permease PerM
MDEQNNSSQKYFLDISWGTIFKILVAVFSIYFIFLIGEFIIWFVFALIISILFEPIVKFLVKRKIPRVLAVVSVYFVIFGIIGYSLYLLLPFFFTEMQKFAVNLSENIPDYLERAAPVFSSLGLETPESFSQFLLDFQDTFGEMEENLLSSLLALFGGILATFFTFSLAIFLSFEKGLMEKGLALFFPKKYEGYLLDLWNRSKKKVTGWFLVRIAGIIFVGFSSYVAFKVLGINYPVSFAMIMGMSDFIPILGPIVASAFIILTVSMDSFLQAGFALVALGLIQILEENVFLPVMTSKAVKISPAVVLISLFIGGKLWGILGAILLVPLVAILFEFLKDFLSEKKDEIFSGPSNKDSL